DERATAPGWWRPPPNVTSRRGCARRSPGHRATMRVRSLLSILTTVLTAGQALGAVPVRTMQCCEVKPGAFASAPLAVESEFGMLAYSPRFPHRLCLPVTDSGESVAAQAVAAQVQSLLGYVVRTSARPVRSRQVVSQFGSLTLDVKRPDLLLVPTAVSPTAPPR